ncbi:TetR/AcrR family transcriptional regulator [Dermatobacter hominis]|uniref:TetR/AcrR family transcriptional regulator n=1 Tax=Dermatobacter hominis TaxID=2884263 RepID=UPI001D1120FF|nr:TetR/AcrR family transcriptional regulator [Dermatobacter hominis]UDY37005.1 TetR/AcrR family transcriptional regulator [Dermatobacter hominis]
MVEHAGDAGSAPAARSAARTGGRPSERATERAAEPDAGAPRTARARARAALVADITDLARRQLAESGPAGLSLRAVARELGMASSAVYRYFPSRDDLLTTLIIDAYDAIGDVAEREDAAAVAAGATPGERWLRTCRAVRAWAIEHPHEWALVYGSPVVGYAAPVDTVGPAARVATTLAGITIAALAEGSLEPPAQDLGTASLLDPGVVEIAGGVPEPPFDDVVGRALTMWVSLIGTISFELFGHFHNVVTDTDEWFDASMAIAAESTGMHVPR